MIELTERQKMNFEKKFQKRSMRECWNWEGCLATKGYGQFWTDEGMRRAHRVSYVLYNGPIPKFMLVCHKCDNRLCVNPNHLFLGTNMDNMRDRATKGRTLKGENASRVKIRQKDVLEIRKLYTELGMMPKKIAPIFGINASTVSNIVARRSWRHI